MLLKLNTRKKMKQTRYTHRQRLKALDKHFLLSGRKKWKHWKEVNTQFHRVISHFIKFIVHWTFILYQNHEFSSLLCGVRQCLHNNFFFLCFLFFMLFLEWNKKVLSNITSCFASGSNWIYGSCYINKSVEILIWLIICDVTRYIRNHFSNFEFDFV